jgi:hypothetical protein
LLQNFQIIYVPLTGKLFNQKFQIVNDKKDDKIVYKIALLPLQFEEENIS